MRQHTHAPHALEELSTTLEELRATNEVLIDQATDMGAAIQRSEDTRRDLNCLFSTLPVPCVSTDATGRILDANPHASRLLNVGRQHLAGKPLFLFFTDRDPLLHALESPPLSGEFEQVTVVRPRERRPREILLRGRRLPSGDRWYWYLTNREAEPEPHGAAE